MAAGLVFSWRRGIGRWEAILLSWVPLHLLLFATGSLGSPLLPLLAAWVVAIAVQRRRWMPIAAALAVVLPLAAEWRLAAPPAPAGGLRLVLLVVLAGAVSLYFGRAASRRAARPTRTAATAAHDAGAETPVRAEAESDLLGPLLELVRLATGAAEATLWVWEPGTAGIRPEASAGAGEDSPEAVTRSEGHPYTWVLNERTPIHLQPGRKPLPRPWAAEMLLVPLRDTDELLGLAFRAPVAGGAQETALLAGSLLATSRRLARHQAVALRQNAHLQLVAETVQALHRELQTGAFAEVLCHAAADLVGADGAAIALWDADTAAGSIVATSGATLMLSPSDRLFEDGSSRMALACKHGTPLRFDDLDREPRLPVCSPGERWAERPRAIIIQPIIVHGATLGAALLWHPSPHHFAADHEESARLLCSLAAAPLQSALRYTALDRRAAADPLTGLANRGTFDSRFAAVCAQFQRYGRPFSLIALDIDHFKRFNDSWGHEAGDRVLQHVASVLRRSVREVDLPARLGGEEFLILLPETQLDQALAVAERVRRSIESGVVPWNGKELRVTASFGVAACPETSRVATDSLTSADAALYASKDGGRNRVSVATPAP